MLKLFKNKTVRNEKHFDRYIISLYIVCVYVVMHQWLIFKASQRRQPTTIFIMNSKDSDNFDPFV